MNSATTDTPQSFPGNGILWKGSSSQWLNLGAFSLSGLVAAALVAGAWWLPSGSPLLTVLLSALVIPLGYVVWRILVVRCRVFTLTAERLRITEGVINQHLDEVELYRVKDILMTRNWWMRLTGLATIRLLTSERSLPELDIPAIPNGMELRDKLRDNVEKRRDAKRVREMDFDSVDSSGLDGELMMD